LSYCARWVLRVARSPVAEISSDLVRTFTSSPLTGLASTIQSCHLVPANWAPVVRLMLPSKMSCLSAKPSVRNSLTMAASPLALDGAQPSSMLAERK